MATGRSASSSGFLSLALVDYLAARRLLIEGQLQAALPLAATAVEKQCKAILSALGTSFGKSEHLSHRLVHLFKDHPGIVLDTDQDFLRFLMRAYDLRYALTQRDSYSIVINQLRTLIHLDEMIFRLDKPFTLTRGNENLLTPLGMASQSKDSNLSELNTALHPDLLTETLTRSNKVVEIGIGKKLLNLVVTYQTDGVTMSGAFLKRPNFDAEKREFQLTFG